MPKSRERSSTNKIFIVEKYSSTANSEIEQLRKDRALDNKPDSRHAFFGIQSRIVSRSTRVEPVGTPVEQQVPEAGSHPGPVHPAYES